jgi:hypothetical protein
MKIFGAPGPLPKPLAMDERIERYRKFAKRAFRLGRAASNKDLRTGYFTMAAAWHSMAEDAAGARGRLPATSL